MYKIEIGEFDGNSWEEIMQKCFKDKYENEHYQRMPANVKGDNGIEGLTIKTGKVFQCYCPNDHCETKELTANQRQKINTDLQKLIKYEDQLKKVLGNQKIKEWHLVIPEFKDKSLIAHCREKEKEYRAKHLSHLDSDFTILIKEYTDFNTELTRHLLLGRLKTDISVSQPNDVDWSKCNSEHIKNLRRKITTLINTQEICENEKKEKIEKIVTAYVFFYQRGLKVINALEKNFPDQYSKFMRIKQNQGENIETECMLSMLSKDKLFSKVQEDLLKALKEGLGENFEDAGIEQLSKRIIAEWLMLCPLDFGG